MGLFGPPGACEINVFRESLFTDPFGRGFEGRLYLCEFLVTATTAGQLLRLFVKMALATPSQRLG